MRALLYKILTAMLSFGGEKESESVSTKTIFGVSLLESS